MSSLLLINNFMHSWHQNQVCHMRKYHFGEIKCFEPELFHLYSHFTPSMCHNMPSESLWSKKRRMNSMFDYFRLLMINFQHDIHSHVCEKLLWILDGPIFTKSYLRLVGNKNTLEWEGESNFILTPPWDCLTYPDCKTTHVGLHEVRPILGQI